MQKFKKMVLKWKSYFHTMILYHNENGKYEIKKRFKVSCNSHKFYDKFLFTKKQTLQLNTLKYFNIFTLFWQ